MNIKYSRDYDEEKFINQLRMSVKSQVQLKRKTLISYVIMNIKYLRDYKFTNQLRMGLSYQSWNFFESKFLIDQPLGKLLNTQATYLWIIAKIRWPWRGSLCVSCFMQ